MAVCQWQCSVCRLIGAMTETTPILAAREAAAADAASPAIAVPAGTSLTPKDSEAAATASMLATSQVCRRTCVVVLC